MAARSHRKEEPRASGSLVLAALLAVFSMPGVARTEDQAVPDDKRESAHGGAAGTVTPDKDRAKADEAKSDSTSNQPKRGQQRTKKWLAFATGAGLAGGGVALVSAKVRGDLHPGTLTLSPTGTGLMAATPFVFAVEGASGPDDPPLTYSWAFGDGTAADSTAATQTHVFLSPGTFTVAARVNSGSKAVAVAPVLVTVRSLDGTWVVTSQGCRASCRNMTLWLTQVDKTLGGKMQIDGNAYLFSVSGYVFGEPGLPRRVRIYAGGFQWSGSADESVATISGGGGEGSTFTMIRQ
jgi:hypothetical protein